MFIFPYVIYLNEDTWKRTLTGLDKGELVTVYVLSKKSRTITVSLHCCHYFGFNYIGFHSQSQGERAGKGSGVFYIFRKYIDIKRGTVYNKLSAAPIKN